LILIKYNVIMEKPSADGGPQYYSYSSLTQSGKFYSGSALKVTKLFESANGQNFAVRGMERLRAKPPLIRLSGLAIITIFSNIFRL